MHRQIEARIARLTTELEQATVLIAARVNELDKLHIQAESLNKRLEEARRLEIELNELGMEELIRMCNTPCWRFELSQFSRFLSGCFSSEKRGKQSI